MGQDPDNIGRYAGWGTGEDVAAPPKPEPEGPAMFPLAYTARRTWGRTLGCFWFPAMIALITIEDWLQVPQVAGWISLIGLLAGFLLLQRWLDRRQS